MSTMIVSIVTNIISDLILWLFLGITLAILLSRRRRRLQGFFGTLKEKSLIVYLGSFSIDSGAIIDRYGNTNKSPQTAISTRDFYVVPILSSLFESTVFDFIAELLSSLVGVFLLIKQPNITFLPSPQKEEDLEHTNTIAIGGPRFNLATEYYLKTGKPYFEFERKSNTWIAKIGRGSRSGETVLPPQGNDIGLIQKVYDTEHQSTVFIAAGIGINGTRTAVDYLVKNWEELRRIYTDNEFGIALTCPHQSIDPDGYKKSTVLLRLP